jgi:hypothetical protein
MKDEAIDLKQLGYRSKSVEQILVELQGIYGLAG